jgi:hypothetical protein
MADDKDTAAPEIASPAIAQPPAGVSPGGNTKLPDELPDNALAEVVGGCCSGKHIDA